MESRVWRYVPKYRLPRKKKKLYKGLNKELKSRIKSVTVTSKPFDGFTLDKLLKILDGAI